jgi:PGF-CTERM protein
VAPAFEVSNLDAPASAVTGDTITVNATISNVGGVAGTTDAEFVFAGDVISNQSVTLGAGNATDVSFDVTLDNISAGTYEHGVRAGDSFLTANITVPEAQFEVSNLDAPASAVTGDTITVNATVSNVGGVAGTTDAEFVFAGDVLLNQSVTLGAGNATDVSFDVPTDGVAPGTYEHGVRAGDSFLTANITIQQPATFEVSNLDAPASAVQGETITVNATVANVGDVQGSTTTEFVFAGDVLLNQSVTLGAGNATDVSFDVPTDGVAPGTYEHGVRAGDSFLTANITIQQPATFEVSNLQAPASAQQGASINVSAVVTNVGDVRGSITAAFEFNGTVLLNETITLDPGNATNVSFQVSTTDIATGNYTHRVVAGSSSESAPITISAANETDTPQRISPGQPGFGVGVAVAALLALLVLARRRS